VNPEKRKTT